MGYLVDGNNVMGQRVGWHRDRAGARRRLLDELARFARASGVPVAVVFDGPPVGTGADGADGAGVEAGVRVHYAGRGADADTRILELVAASGRPEGLDVVTSDRRLAESVRRLGAGVVRSGELRRRLDALSGGDGGGGGGGDGGASPGGR